MRLVITIFLSLTLLTQIPLERSLNARNAQFSSSRCSSAAASAADELAKQFDQHQFVFIGSTHGDLKIEQFLACLVTRAAFRERVTDVVTEWASSGQQRLIDRYNKTFFVDARRFPANMPWPESLRIRNEETSKNLADYIDGFVYLGPEPDKSLIGAIPLIEAQQRELARRNSITSDWQRAMQARFKGRAQWFSAHPNDIPARPQF